MPTLVETLVVIHLLRLLLLLLFFVVAFTLLMLFCSYCPYAFRGTQFVHLRFRLPVLELNLQFLYLATAWHIVATAATTSTLSLFVAVCGFFSAASLSFTNITCIVDNVVVTDTYKVQQLC
uniref:Uncharacterized protein n=1 Tax=Glossina palpalis gambiensis TaxID=67801 RepID=A0A1B0BE89_9MUSC